LFKIGVFLDVVDEDGDSIDYALLVQCHNFTIVLVSEPESYCIRPSSEI
jgi:hypothetical protein